MRTTGNDSGRDKTGASSYLTTNGHRPAVICDFDETTAVENVAHLILSQSPGATSWQDLRTQSQSNDISFREYQEESFRKAGMGLEQMQDLVRQNATLRSHFKELSQLCQSHNIPLAIVTVGLDFYVDALLDREELGHIPRYSASTSFSVDGIDFDYPHCWDGTGASNRETCSRWGTCKCSVVNAYKRTGHSVIYVGDGVSDYCPASIADFVFARSLLAEVCKDKGLLHAEFEDFKDVADAIQAAMDAGMTRQGPCGEGEAR